LVLRSRYLLAIVAIVGLYEVTSTVLDFQFSATISHYLEGPAIGAHLSKVFLITNITSMGVQLFLTSWVMRRFGEGVALTILPTAIVVASLGFLALPLLWMGSLLNPVDGGFAYSVNQSAREALYVPTSRDEKYKAKAFIDMFVQRFAKALAVGVSLTIAAIFSHEVAGEVVLDFQGLRWLSVVTVGVVAVWLMAVRYAGRRFEELTAPAEADSRALGGETVPSPSQTSS
jgi:AAA family ATP:ADP antiporter